MPLRGEIARRGRVYLGRRLGEGERGRRRRRRGRR
jgi:hypothetical protein